MRPRLASGRTARPPTCVPPASASGAQTTREKMSSHSAPRETSGWKGLGRRRPEPGRCSVCENIGENGLPVWAPTSASGRGTEKAGEAPHGAGAPGSPRRQLSGAGGGRKREAGGGSRGQVRARRGCCAHLAQTPACADARAPGRSGSSPRRERRPPGEPPPTPPPLSARGTMALPALVVTPCSWKCGLWARGACIT